LAASPRGDSVYKGDAPIGEFKKAKKAFR
jgi:hypothetical protein